MTNKKIDVTKKTPYLDLEIHRLKSLKRKDNLSPIGEHALIEYKAIKEALNISNIRLSLLEEVRVAWGQSGWVEFDEWLGDQIIEAEELHEHYAKRTKKK